MSAREDRACGCRRRRVGRGMQRRKIPVGKCNGESFGTGLAGLDRWGRRVLPFAGESRASWVSECLIKQGRDLRAPEKKHSQHSQQPANSLPAEATSRPRVTRASELDPGCGMQIEGEGREAARRRSRVNCQFTPRLRLQNLVRQAQKGNSGAAVF